MQSAASGLASDETKMVAAQRGLPLLRERAAPCDAAAGVRRYTAGRDATNAGLPSKSAR